MPVWLQAVLAAQSYLLALLQAGKSGKHIQQDFLPCLVVLHDILLGVLD